MPDLGADAPMLADAGARLNSEWLAAWIADPHSLRADTEMPRIFSGENKSQNAVDVAAYLASLGAGGKNGNAPSASEDMVADGGKLFGGLGCIGCHAVSGVAKEDDGRVPLKFVGMKFQTAALQAFLLDPQKYFAWIWMPNFRLSADEAAKLAAFLFAKSDAPPKSVFPKADVENGKKLVESSGCANCHALPVTNKFKAPPLAEILKTDWMRGCMGADEKSRGTAPDFSLTQEKRDALLAFAATDLSSLKQESLPELAERRITALRCAACHDRDGETSSWQKHAEENAALVPDAPAPEGEAAPLNQPPMLPKLTWLGEKLRTEWAQTFVAGKMGYKPRPWLFARMPGFANYADGIAQGLALEHGFSLAPSAEPPPDRALAEVGKKLIGTDAGFSCTLCHGLGDQAASQPFEAPAPNFSNVVSRIRKPYFQRWMMNPAQIDPDTKMTRFADETGKSPLEELGGDAAKQFEAIWQFLRTAEKK
jgi:cytochrome c553